MIAFALINLFAVANGHGYVFSPPSRSYLCREHVNDPSLCGPVIWEPQSVEGSYQFPKFGPADGRLASGGIDRFGGLDRPSDRWFARSINYEEADNEKVKQAFDWYLTAPHSTASFRVFVTNARYNVTDHPLRRSDLHLTPSDYVCEQRMGGAKPNRTHTVHCEFPRDAFLTDRQQAFLAVWDVGDNYNAFYQIIDFRASFTTQTTEPATTKVTTTTTTMDGSANATISPFWLRAAAKDDRSIVINMANVTTLQLILFA